MEPKSRTRGDRPRRIAFVVFCVFLVFAILLLWTEHRAHVLGALPYLFLLLCPAMHFLMHRGHDHAGSSAGGATGENDDRSGT